MSTDALERAVEIKGGQTPLANAIGVTQQHIWNWLHRDKKVPAEYAIPIERATDGQVPRHAVRPDIYPVEPMEAAE